MITEEDIQRLLRDFGDRVAIILEEAGYFDGEELDEETLDELEAISREKNQNLWHKLWPWLIVPALASGIKRTSRDLRQPITVPLRIMVSIYSPTPARIMPFTREYYNKHGLELVKTLTKTDVARLKPLLEEHVLTGKEELTEAVKNSFPCSPARLNLIKRSEHHTAQQYGGYGYAKACDANTKTWHTMQDDRVRAEHVLMEGETVGIEDLFSNGLEWPCEPNCRCWLTYSY